MVTASRGHNRNRLSSNNDLFRDYDDVRADGEGAMPRA